MNRFFTFISLLSLPFLNYAQSYYSDSEVNKRYLFDKQNPDSIFSKEFGKVISLNGKWAIAEGNFNKVPKQFPYTIQVPGLVNAKETGFKEIGKESNLREAYWFKKEFRIDGSIPSLVRLKMFKAMYGTKVFLNGNDVGENPLNFTPGYFDVTKYIKGNNQLNVLIIRVGSFIDKCADTVLNGGDAEKHRYVPGIYDRVELVFSHNTYVVRTQVVPNLQRNSATVEIEANNVNFKKEDLELIAEVFETKSNNLVASMPVSIRDISNISPQKTTLNIPIPNCKYWTPDSPNLYVLKISDKKFSYHTRFGMRTFRVDTSFTNRVLLNEVPYYIRGTNFAVNRFYEDSLCFQQPWNKEWVRKLFVSYRKMGMNGVRFSISSVPEIWYDIADEEGMLIFDEFPIWSAYQADIGSIKREAESPIKKWAIVKPKIKAKHIANEFTKWMQERWNHACVIVWDAQNETWSPEIGKAITMVRNLDLSNRPWDNGWSPPVSTVDLREAHPYFEAFTEGTEQKNDRKRYVKPFTLDDIPNNPLVPSTFYLPYQYAYKQLPLNWYWQQATVNNEYSYLWLQRNGEPTKLTKPFYEAVLGDSGTANQRREIYAKYLAAVTEYWRSLRTCVAVLYPFGINYSMSEGETSDNLTNLDSITFDSYFLKYVPHAFAPVGISIDFWKTKVELKDVNGTALDFPIYITNDENYDYSNFLYLRLIKDGKILKEIKTKYQVAAIQQSRVIIRMDMPDLIGKYVVEAEIITKAGTVKSYRDIELFK